MRTTKTILAFAGLLTLGGLSLQAGTSNILNFGPATGGPTDNGYTISPYTGTVNGTSVTLYCDDFNDNINWGQTDIAVNVTALPFGTLTQAQTTTLQDQTRYGDVNPSTAGKNYPAGTQLYDEMAWLTTQMQNLSGGSAAYNEVAIQEAIWTLTNDNKVNEGASPQTHGTSQTGTFSDAGVNQSYAAWITDAAADYNQTVSGYTTLSASSWEIITAVASQGCTVGSNGTTGCSPGTPGTANSSGWVTQEFLAYTGSGGGTIITGGLGGAPEPASFLLLGSGLLAGAIFGRRRKSVS